MLVNIIHLSTHTPKTHPATPAAVPAALCAVLTPHTHNNTTCMRACLAVLRCNAQQVTTHDAAQQNCWATVHHQLSAQQCSAAARCTSQTRLQPSPAAPTPEQQAQQYCCAQSIIAQCRRHLAVHVTSISPSHAYILAHTLYRQAFNPAFNNYIHGTCRQAAAPCNQTGCRHTSQLHTKSPDPRCQHTVSLAAHLLSSMAQRSEIVLLHACKQLSVDSCSADHTPMLQQASYRQLASPLLLLLLLVSRSHGQPI